MMRTRWALLVMVASLTLGAAPAPAEDALQHVDVFVSGTGGYHTFRIPAIETAPDGSLLAVAEARKHSSADPGWEGQDIDLVCKRSTDGGKTWSAMQMIEDPGELWSAANPTTVVDRQTKRVWLFYLRSKPGCNTRSSRPGTDDMQTLVRYSDDHGVTWSDPEDLTAVARDMNDDQWRSSVVGPGGAIQTRGGRLIAPVWKTVPYGVFVIYSDDHGKSWRRGGMVPGDNVGNENQVAELSDGRLLIDIRQRGGAHRWLAVSSDGGATWSAPRAGIEVTPVACAIERFVAGPNESPRLVWTGPRGPGRANLVARISRDDGQTFGPERVIAEGPAAYSDLAAFADGAIGVLWERGVERGYQFISFTRLNARWLAAD